MLRVRGSSSSSDPHRGDSKAPAATCTSPRRRGGRKAARRRAADVLGGRGRRRPSSCHRVRRERGRARRGRAAGNRGTCCSAGRERGLLLSLELFQLLLLEWGVFVWFWRGVVVAEREDGAGGGEGRRSRGKIQKGIFSVSKKTVFNQSDFPVGLFRGLLSAKAMGPYLSASVRSQCRWREKEDGGSRRAKKGNEPGEARHRFFSFPSIELQRASSSFFSPALFSLSLYLSLSISLAILPCAVRPRQRPSGCPLHECERITKRSESREGERNKKR